MDTEPILAIAGDSIELANRALDPSGPVPASMQSRASAAALGRLGGLLELQTTANDPSSELFRVSARVAVQTWMIGHAMLLLGPDIDADLERHEAATRALLLGWGVDDLHPGDTPGLADLARRLDAHVYGSTEPPRAFQRHLHSFFDEIDITGVEGTRSGLLADHTKPAPGPAPVRTDYVRVTLWVLLFLAHDHYAAIGAPDQAGEARALFDRLRAATNEFYAARRRPHSRS